MQDRAGQVFGKLTVIADHGCAQLHCRCECGREGSYPRAITKPSYRGPTACPWCLGSPCEECGAIIPNKGRMPAKTCSEACRVARASRRERERYERIKDTEHFRATRAAYLERLAQAMDADPELAESIRDDHRRAVRAWRERQMADPALRARYLEAQRKREAKRLEKIRSDPDAYAEHLRKQREWYHSLSGDDYQRIFRANEAQPASYRRWSEDDDRFIVDNQPFHTISWIAEQLGRTESSVTSRMQRLGISLKRREGHKRAEWASEGLAMLGKVPDVDIAEKLGISKQAVHKKRKRLGIKPCRSRKHSK